MRGEGDAAFRRFLASGAFFDVNAAWADLPTAAHHGLVGPWAKRLEGGRAHLLAVHARQTRLEALTLELCARLEARGVPSVVLKGVSVAARWPTRSLRPQSDIDILVAPGDFERAVEAWVEASLIRRPEAPRLRHFHLALTPVAWPELPVELHVALTDEFALDAPAAQLIAERAELSLEAARLPVLEPATELVYLCVHAATHAGERLRWFFDLVQVCRGLVPWGRVVERASSWRCAWPVWWALHEAEALGAGVPREVMSALSPPRWVRARTELITAAGIDRASSWRARALRLSLMPATAWPQELARKAAKVARRL